MDMLTVSALALLAGAATVLGGIVFSLLKISKRELQFLLTATTGVVIAVIMLGLLPAAMSLGGVGYTALGFIIGGIALMVTGSLFPHTYGSERYEDKLYSLLKTGSLVITGIIIFNIPAGMLIGSGFASSMAVGSMMLIAVVLQNIPRGISLSVPLSRTGEERPRSILILLLAGVPCMVGALLAFAALASAVPVILASGMAFCAGAMLFISADQLTPIVKSGTRMHETAIALFIGVFVGLLILGIG